ncbi:unnamed protein product [Auanema sp. JU1783]|nr:unnamed protein product [Auanema sp. JU1783]
MDNSEKKQESIPVDNSVPAGSSGQSSSTSTTAGEGESKDLSQFVSDVPRLTKEIFDAVGWAKIKTMLPPYLKDCTCEQIYNLVSHELNGMTESRILTIMNGKPVDKTVPEAGGDNQKPQ